VINSLAPNIYWVYFLYKYLDAILFFHLNIFILFIELLWPIYRYELHVPIATLFLLIKEHTEMLIIVSFYVIKEIESINVIILVLDLLEVEGIRTCKVIYDLAKKNNITMPIIEAVYKVLYEQAKPKEVIKDLMERSLKSEE